MVDRFNACGWDGPKYGKGRSPHPFMKKGKRKVPIFNDHGETISAPAIRRVLRIAGISDEEWEHGTE